MNGVASRARPRRVRSRGSGCIVTGKQAKCVVLNSGRLVCLPVGVCEGLFPQLLVSHGEKSPLRNDAGKRSSDT